MSRHSHFQVVTRNNTQQNQKPFVVMNNFFSSALFFGLASLIGYGNAIAQPFAKQSIAQIIPDSSVGTTLTPNVEIKGVMSEVIEGGTIRGANLFHSFSEFNIQNGRGAYFTNPDGITNIFSRITGNNLSNINGILGVLGNANLFLLNPNGIIFGPNARLDLNGSFIGTTANRINFADGTQFSATNPQASSLLTVSVPIGLGFGSNPGAIKVQGTGHNLTFNPTSTLVFPPFTREANPQALTIKPGKTLALVGGDVLLEGGQLVAEQGRIELGSVGAGEIRLNPTATGFALSYEGGSNFRDIQLAQKAAIDASGSTGNDGGIHATGRQIRLTDGSVGLIQNLAPVVQGSTISVNASDLVEFTGTTADGKVRSNFTTETTTSGASGQIQISTKDLLFREGGQIITRTFAAGDAGKISINASESVQVLGVSSVNTRFQSNIFASSGGTATGNAGDLSISTKQFIATEGAIISNASFSDGAGGNFTLNAELVDISGIDPVFKAPTDLRVGSFRRGNGGNLTLNTQRLIVREGGRINGSTIGRGSAGNLAINASQFIDVNGGIITSSATAADLRDTSLISSLTDDLTGRAGGISINTPRLTVRNAGRVTVQNNGPTDAGNLRLNVGSVVLDNNGLLSASTKLGEGGNINLQVRNTLVLRNGSLISAEAGGRGNGGNLTLHTNSLVALENSDITANAFQGQGGNIAIATQGLFRSTDSDITASSQLGLSGTVNVSTLNANQQNVVQPPPSNFVNTDQVVANSCLARIGNSQGSFAIAGNGGLPETPESSTIPYEVVQVRATETSQATPRQQESKPTPTATPNWKPGDPIVEATEFSVNARGQVVLTANRNTGATAICLPAGCAIAQPQPLPCQPN